MLDRLPTGAPRAAPPDFPTVRSCACGQSMLVRPMIGQQRSILRLKYPELADAFVAQLREALPESGRTLLVRAFHVGSWTASRAYGTRAVADNANMNQLDVATLRRVLGEDDPVYTSVPCRIISTKDADGWTLALCIVYAPEDDIVLSTAS
jgi:hypothetical protein